MKHKLNFQGEKSKSKTLEEHLDDEFRRLEWGFDDIEIDALNDAAEKIRENINSKEKGGQ